MPSPAVDRSTSRGAASPATSMAHTAVPVFLGQFAVLVLIALTVHLYRIEEGLRLPEVMPVITLAFALNAWLPLRWRLPVLVIMFFGLVGILFGPQHGLVFSLISLAMFSLLALPLHANLRFGLVVVFGLILTAFRAGWLPLPGAKEILPLLGSVFMFRTILFLHEQNTMPASPGFWKNAAYFFQLPNLAFVIFPVTDYRTFTGQYYNRPAAEIYRRGLLMVANGLLHLFLYRLIYYYLLPPPSAVTDLLSLSQYLIASYALIVRLAGIFHFSAGVMCLFGFNLPPVFEHYFFAKSFSDIWRRINIYWRDFMTKVFYFPIYFRLKHLGTARAMVLAVLIVFVINWFLHAWQWFWIRGRFPLTWQDGIFWSFFGVAVAINTWLQTRQKRRDTFPGFHPGRAALLSLQVLGMFTLMTFLWSFWTSGSTSEWWTLLQAGRVFTRMHLAIIAGSALILVAGGTLYQFLVHKIGDAFQPSEKLNASKLVLAGLGLSIMVTAGLPALQRSLSLSLQADLTPVFRSKLNAYDREQMYKGYYETLLVGSNLNSRVWEMEQKKPDDWQQLGFSGAGIRRDDIMLKELKPNQRIPFKGGMFTTNNLGLRDRDYSAVKPEQTVRIALLGGSIEMGVGVNTDETYENLAEDELNAMNMLEDSSIFEILNFGISGNHLFQNVAMFEQKALPLDPDAVLYAAHSNEGHRVLNSIYKAYTTGRDMVYPYLTELLERHAISRATTEVEFMRRLGSEQDGIVRAGYSLIKGFAEEKDCLPLWMYVPTLDDNEIPGEADRLEEMAQSLGFFTLRLDKTYLGRNPEDLKLAEWDTHPNREGHRLLADEMVRRIMGSRELIEAIRALPR